MARKYTKRSEYWESRKNKAAQTMSEVVNASKADFSPELSGEPFYNYDTTASYTRSGLGNAQSASRRNTVTSSPKSRAYSNIENGMSPFEYSADGVNARFSIELCQKAYYNVPIFRNSIDMLSDFTNSNLYLEGGSAKSRNLVKAWFKKIKLWSLKDQFFRELYRGSNIFLYRINGKFKIEDFAKIRKLGLVSDTNEIPIRYIMLNPADMVSRKVNSFDDTVYEKILSEFEIEALKNPKNEDDKELFEALSPEIQKQIKQGNFNSTGISAPLDPKRLRYSFYKKQDYEPFAAPFAFGVLDDINFKMEMKKIDQSICRTIENVILLITMGTEPEKGGINPNNLGAMQRLFQNESVGRVLVSDYTTKADFIIPDIKKVIGPEKYEVINQDIKEGLQNIIISQEKFANTEIKAQMFLQRLKEARDTFLHDFLQPEIKSLCKDFGLKNCPTAKFETIDLKDTAQIQRVITRMMELAILHPEDGMKVIETGVFPTAEELNRSQERLVEERKKGFYNPIVGGTPFIKDPNDENVTPIGNTPKKNTTPKTAGRPVGKKTLAKERYSIDGIKDIVGKTNDLYSVVVSEAKKSYKKSRLNKTQKEIVGRVCESIVVSTPIDKWEKTAKACLADTNQMLNLNTMEEISEISLSHELDEYASAILYHSSLTSKN